MDIKALRAFAAIVEEGSFTAAARRLRLSKAMCSKLISDLEADLAKAGVPPAGRLPSSSAADDAKHRQEEKVRAEKKARLYFWAGIVASILCMFGGYLLGKFC